MANELQPSYPQKCIIFSVEYGFDACVPGGRTAAATDVKPLGRTFETQHASPDISAVYAQRSRRSYTHPSRSWHKRSRHRKFSSCTRLQ